MTLGWYILPVLLSIACIIFASLPHRPGPKQQELRYRLSRSIARLGWDIYIVWLIIANLGGITVY